MVGTGVDLVDLGGRWSMPGARGAPPALIMMPCASGAPGGILDPGSIFRILDLNGRCLSTINEYGFGIGDFVFPRSILLHTGTWVPRTYVVHCVCHSCKESRSFYCLAISLHLRLVVNLDSHVTGSF